MLPIVLENPFIIYLLHCQVAVIAYASEAEEFSQVLTKPLSLSLMTHLDRSLWHLRNQKKSQLVFFYYCDRSRGGSSPYIRFIFHTHSPSEEVKRHLSILAQQRVIIVGIQCFFFESLPIKNTVIMVLYDGVICVNYLLFNRCPKMLDIFISTTQIPENGWR
jgi:hypothetical protein